MNDLLYKEELLDHYKHPRNYGELSDAHVRAESYNPSCGDAVVLYVNFTDTGIGKIMFQGKGCVISQAAASLLTEHASTVSFKELKTFGKDDMLLLLGIQLGPTRLRCALLAQESLHKALTVHEEGHHA